MNNSDILKLFAQANRSLGHNKYADLLENTATVYEANEVIKESETENEGNKV